MKIYLTTYLPKDSFRPRAIRRRRKIAEGEKVRIGFCPLSRLDEEMSGEEGDAVQAVFVDGAPVAFVNPFSSEWNSGPWWGTGIDFVR